ncbi:MAG: hypothetical protein JRI23_31165 [Deltaproteobacteria bacterium]|jgi:hypothetical protein|nr:hypothetical protein [Deltaproteobacteria bacterium]MBW2536663.1 hypothetical protein [Deltaproteobacteria bacterium]
MCAWVSSSSAEPTGPTTEDATASGASSVWAEVWKSVYPSTKWYLHYEAGRRGGESLQRFHVSRGYLTLKLKPTAWFQPRITMDAHQDDTGDWKMRLKYLHAKLVAPVETAVVTKPSLELGLAHVPWFDYEEHINDYRAEGKMPIERIGVLNSADLGVTAGALLGEELPEDYQERVSSKYPGAWGSLAFGLYNGGGYHAAEQNENKVFMSRLSLRPAGPAFPNLQLSHFFVYGKGNTAEQPKWWLHNFLMSVESEYVVVAGQAGVGRGNQAGDLVDEIGSALHWAGWSTFAEVKLPWIMSSLIGRVDAYDWGSEGSFEPTHRFIAGHAFHFLPHNFLLASVDVVGRTDATPPDRQAKLTLQVCYP